jgi:AraC family ethanolamine operon transcriptional activator
MEHFLIKNSFNDFDEFAHAIQAWDLDFRQLDGGASNIDMLQAPCDKSLLTNTKLNRHFDQLGAAPPENWTFALFSEQSSPFVWRGQEISNNTIVVCKSGSEIDCVSRPGFEVFTISYPEGYLSKVIANLGLPELKNLVKNSDNFMCNLSELSEIRRQLHQMINLINRRQSQIGNTSFIKKLDAELSEQILLTVAKALPPKNISINLRNQAIKLIKEYLNEFPQEPITVSRLCSIAGVSIRTLQYAFQEHYGVSPKTFLKNFRLNYVRRELRKSHHSTTRVNDVASLWGFWHMGQFAADYRKLFGELPSDTLNRKKCDLQA